MFNLVLILLSSVVYAGGFSPDAEVSKFLATLRKHQDLSSKLTTIADFKKRLQSAKVGPKDKSTVYGLQTYLSKIEERFTTDQCENVHVRIIFAFSPQDDDPDYIPPEAKVAFDALAELCK